MKKTRNLNKQMPIPLPHFHFKMLQAEVIQTYIKMWESLYSGLL